MPKDKSGSIFCNSEIISCELVLHTQAYVDLVRAWGWRSFTIIYETNEGLVRLQELLKAHGPSEFPIAVRQLPDDGDYRYVDVVLCPSREYMQRIVVSGHY